MQYVRGMRWTVHGERTVYDSPWVRLSLADIEVPGGDRFEHHVVRMPVAAAGVVVHDRQRGVLLLWRHRFITDTWGWEIPAGRLDAGESPEQAARREVLEETGWSVGELQPLLSYAPMNGISDARVHLFLAADAVHEGAPTDRTEAERVEWVAVDELRRMVTGGQMSDGLSLTALLYAFTTGLL